jgi:glycogen debranching enzyme
MRSLCCLVAVALLGIGDPGVRASQGTPDKFPHPHLPAVEALPTSGLELSRPTRAGTFFSIAGRRSAFLGYEHRALEAWVYPLKVLEDFSLSFHPEGYALDRDILSHIVVRPETTTLTYAHAAFVVRQTMLAPINEQGLVLLLDVRSTLPLTIRASFRPRLRLMWPGTSTTPWTSWDATKSRYELVEESGRFAAVVGAPGARDLSLMPYQEEPRDEPLQMEISTDGRRLQASTDGHRPTQAQSSTDGHRQTQTQGSQRWSVTVPIVIAGSVAGREAARTSYERILGSIPKLHDATVAHYRRLLSETTDVATPDERLDRAFKWAKVGIDRGLATNPTLGTGLVAGFRVSGESERPGFAWFFGRDAMWTVPALTSYGAFDTARAALEFLARHQRADGKIPHEISQSASYVNWFDGFPYPWASADATPLYVIAQGDYWRATGDRAFLQKAWPSIEKAYLFTRETDPDGNGLVDNTKVGHGWVEGGALYPPHEEIYQQGVWVAAQQIFGELADALEDQAKARNAREGAERTRAAIERTYWLDGRGFYAYATKFPQSAPSVAEPGPDRARRQARLDELASRTLFDELTVLAAVPMWWRVLDPARADRTLDHLSSSAIATDWGARILSRDSRLYSPLSYHYGSVWPLFTGWASMGAYRYGRSHAGYQALMANALLTEQGALGSVTELLSGEFNAPFGLSSHHQIWSQAMVATPIARGLFGIEASEGGRHLTFAPTFPADWNHARVRNIAVGRARLTVEAARSDDALVFKVERATSSGGGAPYPRLTLAPAFPRDARIDRVIVNGVRREPRVTIEGDVQRVHVDVDPSASSVEASFGAYLGTDVFLEREPPLAGAENRGLRVLRSRADGQRLMLLLEGRAGETYELGVRGRRVEAGATSGIEIASRGGGQALRVRFEGADGDYVRREIALPFADR